LLELDLFSEDIHFMKFILIITTYKNYIGISCKSHYAIIRSS
jgi:hypothetical protein